MAEAHHRTFSSSALDALHERSFSLRPARTSDMNSVQPDFDTTSRATRLRKDSKIGLRGIFTRSKTGKTDKDSEEASSRPTGIRASLADFSHWPSRLHSSADSRSTDFSSLRRPSSNSRMLQSPSSLSSRLSAVPWYPPAFFQVYPQAVKHATLPVCKIPVETLARNTSKFVQGHRFGSLERVNDSSNKRDTLKRKQRFNSIGNSREWTNKIFVLISSGYLLQYAAEGTFDRMPEKILQLTATSAAFASDLVPGKHWVLQVASITDANGNTIMEAKPRRSKIAKENEQVSTMLLILDNAESMDEWLAMLRKEIQFHGGKKKASETGRFETDLPEEPSSKTMIARNSRRLSLVTPQTIFYPQESPLTDDAETQADRASIFSVENGSPTASMISSEGRRLDNLRHSGSSHRLSFVSSGQRTMVTSADSSPTCSPTRASFSSQGDDLQPSPKATEVRLRPNASAIVSRRQSIQAMISLFETPLEQYPYQYANENDQPSTMSVPNFSVPHATGRRFSIGSSSSSGLSPTQPTADHERSSKSSRKLPPTSLLLSRPLSIVMDQPSPRSPRSSNSVSRSIDSCESIPFELNDAAVVLSTSPEQGAYTYARNPPSPPNGKSDFAEDIYYGMDEDTTSYSPRQMLPGMSPIDYSCEESDLIDERDIDEWKPASSSCSPKRSNPILRHADQCSPPQSPTTDSQGKFVMARKSMPHLTEGPPPAPPPNCALPPIPRRS